MVTPTPCWPRWLVTVQRNLLFVCLFCPCPLNKPRTGFLDFFKIKFHVQVIESQSRVLMTTNKSLCIPQFPLGKIKELFAPGVIDTNALLVLANVIYFKASWEHKFEEQKTVQRDFKLNQVHLHSVNLDVLFPRYGEHCSKPNAEAQCPGLSCPASKVWVCWELTLPLRLGRGGRRAFHIKHNLYWKTCKTRSLQQLRVLLWWLAKRKR